MKTMGAILAGGKSRRFGSDKAAALYKGKPLIDHAADALRPHVAALAVVGRDWPGMVRVEDYPAPGVGPLGGLCGAHRHAREHGFDAVLSASCDVLGLTEVMLSGLFPGPAILAELPVVGLWPVALADPLAEWLDDPAFRSVYAFADKVGARRVAAGVGLVNINRPEDLESAP